MFRDKEPTKEQHRAAHKHETQQTRPHRKQHKPSAHPGVAKVAFTGSTATGRSVALAAAQNLRPATAELGGKSALIVFEDADLDKAVEWCMFGAFWTCVSVVFSC